MERILCVLIGYICGLFQTSYLYGKDMVSISVITEAEMQERPMHCVHWAQRQEQSHCLETVLNV